MKNKVCVFGGCALDQMFYQNEDGTYDEEPSLKVPGGKGANQAVAASRAGAETTIIARIGKDEIGEYIAENLEDNSVDVSNVEMIEGLQNDCANIYINAQDKDNEIKRKSGAIDQFTPDMIEKYKDVLLDSEVIMCQLKVPKEVTKELIEFCDKNNKKLILTPCRPAKLSINEPENLDLIDKIDIITCNRSECETIFGTDDIEFCVKQYPNKLIVTLGKDGLMYCDGEKVVHFPAIETEVVDTVGAGDTFAGNLSAFVAEGTELKRAIRKAMYAPAMSITQKTAQNGMPYREDLEKYISEVRESKLKLYEELTNLVERYYAKKSQHNKAQSKDKKAIKVVNEQSYDGDDSPEYD